MKLEGKRALVVGLGESGRAAVRFLGAHGARISATDRQSEAELQTALHNLNAMGIRLHLGGHPESVFLEQDLIIPSPGVPWDLPQLAEARRRGIWVMGELEVAAEFLKGPVIGVTGTNGKTTTTSLIGHILQSAGWEVRTGGNIGAPVLSMVDDSTDDTWNVLELSSFQLEATESFRVHIAVVLNVTPDHLDRHGTFERYVAAKARILQAQSARDHAVLHADDGVCRQFAQQAHGRVCWFSREHPVSPGVWVENGWVVLNGKPVVRSQLPLRGSHNLENALAAVAVGALAEVPSEAIGEAVRTFQPVEHRLEFVRTLDGVDYYNDSKATNVDAASKAIEAFEGGLWVILGGTDKDSDYRRLQRPLRERARGVALIGASARKIDGQLNGCVPAYHAETLQHAVEYLRRQARAGDTVLLAPACASFDQFENFAHRGRVFKQLVRFLV